MGKYSPKDATHSIREGIRTAERHYSKASGVPLWEGPEYLINVYIFRSILRRLKNDCLTLELRPTVADDYARRGTGTRATPRRRPPSSDDERPNGHCDAILWWPNKNVTRAVIEVKKRAKDCERDIDRAITRLRNGLEFGVLASLLRIRFEHDSKSAARSQLLQEFHALADSIGRKVATKHAYEMAPERGNIKETNEFDEDDFGHKVRYLWCPVTFLISEKRKT
jgi:hypothetical protein